MLGYHWKLLSFHRVQWMLLQDHSIIPKMLFFFFRMCNALVVRAMAACDCDNDCFFVFFRAPFCIFLRAFVVRLFVCMICMPLLFVLWLPDWCCAGKLGIPLTGITPACWASPPSSPSSSSPSSRTIRIMIIHTGSKHSQPVLVLQSKKYSDHLWAIKINYSVEYSLSSGFDDLCRTLTMNTSTKHVDTRFKKRLNAADIEWMRKIKNTLKQWLQYEIFTTCQNVKTNMMEIKNTHCTDVQNQKY